MNLDCLVAAGMNVIHKAKQLFGILMFFMSESCFSEDKRSDFVLATEQFGKINIQLPQAIGGRSPEAILGSTLDFEYVRDFSPNDPPRLLARSVARLDILYERGTTFCTAFLVADDVLASAKHCIPGTGEYGKAVAAKARFNFLHEQDESMIHTFDVDVVPIETFAEVDMALLKIPPEAGRMWGTLNLSENIAEVGMSLTMIHHPLAAPMRFTRKDCRRVKHKSVASHEIAHSCDALPGSSGAPIVENQAGKVVAVHFAGDMIGGLNFASSIKEAARKLKELAGGNVRIDRSTEGLTFPKSRNDLLRECLADVAKVYSTAAARSKGAKMCLETIRGVRED